MIDLTTFSATKLLGKSRSNLPGTIPKKIFHKQATYYLRSDVNLGNELTRVKLSLIVSATRCHSWFVT